MPDEFDEFEDGGLELLLAGMDEPALQNLESGPSQHRAVAPVAKVPIRRNLHPVARSGQRSAAVGPSAQSRAGRLIKAVAPDNFDDDDDFDDSFLANIDEIDSQLSGGNPSKEEQGSSRDDASAALFFMSSSPEPPLARAPLPPAKATATTAASSAVSATTRSDQAGPSARPAQGSSASQLPRRSISNSFVRMPSNGSQLTRTASSSGHRQMTLFGDAVPEQTQTKSVPQSTGRLTTSSATTSSLAQSASSSRPNSRRVSTKQWDRTAYAKSGRLVKGKGKGKAKQRPRDEYGALLNGDENDDDDDDDNDDDDDGDDDGDDLSRAENWDADSSWQNKVLPPPKDPALEGPPKPIKQQIDRQAAETWIYPINMERRDYQYNIVQKSLFNNVLVALPTGLGKTFIAAVVILNFFRWFPQGKIVFLAPTRPLVDQQKIACHGICGLPWDTAIDLTGSTKRSLRGDHWQTKRIFYMTPQTFENDLRSGACDPRDIVCIVVDEAHRATGRYAYGNVVSILMQSNPHFRVLALTATPGSNADKVQQVIDRLHIGLIELRTESSLDISKYIHRKTEEIVHICLGRDLNAVRDKWARLMRTHMDPLSKAGLLTQNNPILLHPFAVRSLGREPRLRALLNQRPQLWRSQKELAEMAVSMQYLIEQSVTMFYNRLLNQVHGTDVQGKKAAPKKQQVSLNNNSTVQEIIRELETMQDDRGRIAHPKMCKLRDLVSEHFSKFRIERLLAEDVDGVVEGQPSNGGAASAYETRVMVFCSFRECVAEIVDYLNASGLKATPFVGQATSTNGGKGMTQRDQERVIQQFKDGVFNVLVATSIGEEGLDIGEVDLTVCYEAVKDSIRMLQRVGRTGRKRAGRIIVLMSEGREEVNWEKSKDSYKSVQKDINSGLAVELYDDVDRMVPSDIRPQAELKKVDQPKFEPSMVADGLRSTRKGAGADKEKRKAKRNSDPARNIPKGGLMGFLKASKLAKKRKGGRGRDQIGNGDGDDDDDDDDSDDDSDDPATRRRKKLLLSSSSELSDPDKVAAAASSSSSSLSSDEDDNTIRPLRRDLFGHRKAAISKQQKPEAGAESSTTPRSQPGRSSDSSARQTSQSGSTSSIKKRLGTRRAGTETKPPTPVIKANPTAAIEVLDSSQEPSMPRRAVMDPDSVDQTPPPSDRSKPKPTSGKPRSSVSFADSPSKARAKRKLGEIDSEQDDDDDDEFDDLYLNSDLERQIGDITQAIRPKPSLGSAAKRSKTVSATSMTPLVISSSQPDKDLPSPLRPCRIAMHPLVAELAAGIESDEGDEGDAAEPVGDSARRARRGRAKFAATNTNPLETDCESVVASDDAADSDPPLAAADDAIVRPTKIRRRAAPRRILATSSQSPPPAHPVATESSAAASGPPDAADPGAAPWSTSRSVGVGTMGPPDSVPRRTARSTRLPDPDDSPLSRPAPVRPRRRLVPANGHPTTRSTTTSTSASTSAAAGKPSNPLHSSPPPSRRKAVRSGRGKKKRIGGSPTSRALFQYEAERSTDESVHGEGDEADSGIGSDDENDEDRRAVGHFEPTQAPKGYNQTSVYMGSLLTQTSVTPFKHRANRAPFPGIGGRFGLANGHPPPPTHPADSQDRYSEDSFVAGDDEEILYDDSTDGLMERSSQF